MINNTQITKLLAFFLFAAAAAIILTKSILVENGNISPDSTYYLGLAENIIGGHGLFINNNGLTVARKTYFSTWPVGYPVLIAVTAQVLRISTFLASKILNIIFLGGSMLLVAKNIAPRGHALAVIMLFASTINIYSYTWSEAPFIFFLILISTLLGKALEPQSGNGIVLYFAVMLSGLGLFLSRYIGIFSVVPILLIAAILLYRGDRLKSVKMAMAGLIPFFLALAYLAHNKTMTGYATGRPRAPAPESGLELIWSLFFAVIQEIILLLPAWKHKDILQLIIGLFCVSIIVLLAYFIYKNRSMCCRIRNLQYIFSFSTVGLAYLGTIIIARFITYFDAFGYRFLSPGSVLIYIALFSFLMQRYRVISAKIALFLFAMVFLSLTIQGVSAYLHRSPADYFSSIEKIRTKYAHVPSGSIVISEEKHLRYLRPDIHVFVLNPKHLYSLRNESLSDFLQPFDKSPPIFLDTEHLPGNIQEYHRCIQELFEENTGHGLFQVRE